MNNPSLCEAAAINNPVLVRELLGQGADVYSTDKYGLNALHWAAMRGCVPVMKILLRRHPDMVTSTCRVFHRTALHYSSEGRDQCTKVYVKYLCKYFNGDFMQIADLINKQDKHKYTALHYAAKTKSKQNSILLISHGADPTIVNYLGQTAMDLWDPEERDIVFGGGQATKAAKRREYITNV